MHSSEQIPSSDIDRFIAACESYGALHLPLSSVRKEPGAPEQVIALRAGDVTPETNHYNECFEVAKATSDAIYVHSAGHMFTIGDIFDVAGNPSEDTPEIRASLDKLNDDTLNGFLFRSYAMPGECSRDEIVLTIVKTTGQAALGTTVQHSAKILSGDGVETELTVFTYPSSKGTQKRDLRYRIRPARNPEIDGVIQFFVERDDPESVSVVSEVFINELAGDAESLATNQRLLGDVDEESRNQLLIVIEQAQKHKSARSFAAQFNGINDSGVTTLRSLTTVLIGQSISLLN